MFWRALLPLLLAATAAQAQECAPPAVPTEWHAPKKLRQALEVFRQGVEKERAAAEADRVNSTGHWGYRPFRMQRGLGIATVRLGMNSEGPDSYRSDAVSVEMYIHGKNVFQQRVFPYIREWQRRKP